MGGDMKIDQNGYKDYGNRSAVDPQYSINMVCETCKTKWVGCWDNYECPECGNGELPWKEELAIRIPRNA